MTVHAVRRAPRQLVYLSVRMQPRAHRDRYLRELMAELYVLPGSQQLGYATRVLAESWALRSALTEPAPASSGGATVIRTPAPPPQLPPPPLAQVAMGDDRGRRPLRRMHAMRQRPVTAHQADAGHVRWGTTM